MHVYIYGMSILVNLRYWAINKYGQNITESYKRPKKVLRQLAKVGKTI